MRLLHNSMCVCVTAARKGRVWDGRERRNPETAARVQSHTHNEQPQPPTLTYPTLLHYYYKQTNKQENYYSSITSGGIHA